MTEFSDSGKRLIIIAISLIVLASVTNISAEGWNGIYPLRSHRADVENILGKCRDSSQPTKCIYKQEDRNVLIEYSVGPPCSETETVWNVPNGTVLGITVNQTDGGILIRNLPFDLNEFRREEDPELPGILHFTKPGKGLTLLASSGFVQSFYYGPSAEERKKFACGKVKL